MFNQTSYIVDQESSRTQAVRTEESVRWASCLADEVQAVSVAATDRARARPGMLLDHLWITRRVHGGHQIPCGCGTNDSLYPVTVRIVGHSRSGRTVGERRQPVGPIIAVLSGSAVPHVGPRVPFCIKIETGIVGCRVIIQPV